MTQPTFTPVAPGGRVVQPNTFPTGRFSFPQVSRELDPGTHGVASLTHKGRTFRFRTNPNSFNWTYTLNKHVDETYGGRVIQLLSTKIDDFVVEADCGGGRWYYANAIAKFLRNVMIDQRDGTPATFEYTTRGWKLNVFIVSMPFEDSVDAVLRTFAIQMKVQEDVSGVMSRNSLRAELRRLQNGLQFERNEYNDPNVKENEDTRIKQVVDEAVSNANAVAQTVGYANNAFLPPGPNLRNGIPAPAPQTPQTPR